MEGGCFADLCGKEVIPHIALLYWAGVCARMPKRTCERVKAGGSAKGTGPPRAAQNVCRHRYSLQR